MTNRKTTLFYELQIQRLIKVYGDSIPQAMKEDLKKMILEPNVKEFEDWFHAQKS